MARELTAACDQCLTQIPFEVADPLRDRWRHAILCGLATHRPAPGRRRLKTRNPLGRRRDRDEQVLRTGFALHPAAATGGHIGSAVEELIAERRAEAAREAGAGGRRETGAGEGAPADGRGPVVTVVLDARAVLALI